ncbi:MAG TPA: cytochrome P450 [Sphingobium sp.]|uniref:cytochrome P450 n=1 Tax=Sphingobium sp. TaxID=1912891 RepID=UPI002ED4D3EC
MASVQTEGQDKTGCPVDHGKVLAESTLKDPAILAHPNAYYAAMRADSPVHYDAKLGMYLVSRYEDLQKVFADPVTFSVGEGFKYIYGGEYFEEFKAILERNGGGFFPDAIMSDPPYHTRIRKLMESAFTAHRVKELEPRIAKVIVDFIDGLTDKGRCDAVEDFAVPITIHVICEQLGLDHFDSKKVSRWSQAVTAQISAMQDRDQMVENAKHICDLQNYLIDRMRERERDPREDMISDIVHARSPDGDGSALTFPEAVSLIRAIMIAGNDTTATALSNLIFILATQPEIAQQLKDNADDDRFLNRFVEEMLRIEPPVRGLSRMATRDVELGGTLIPKGSMMLNLYASGNEDPNVFPCPRDFDVTRLNIGRQVAFGGGVHRCVGLALARMEIKITARELIKRWDDIKLDIAVEDIDYLPSVATRTMQHLPITFSRRA